MKIYTITQATYLNVDGEWCGDELEALSGTAKSFTNKDCAIDTLHSWIHETIYDFYEGSEMDASETYKSVLKQDDLKGVSCNIAYMRDWHEWELQLCGRIYKWSMFEQEV